MDNWELWIGVASATAAWAAAMFAYFTLRVAKRRFRLDLEFAERKESEVVVRITESFSMRLEGPDARMLAFSLLLTNPADVPNAINEMELLLDYEVETGEQVTAVIRRRVDSPFPNVDVLSPPVRLGARSSKAGWVFFAVDPTIARKYPVRGYRVVCTDTQARRTEDRAIILREVVTRNAKQDTAEEKS